MPVGSVIATVKSISGSAFVRAGDGSTRRLRAGDSVREGETVLTESGAQVDLVFIEGGDARIADSREVAITSEMATSGSPDASESAVDIATVEGLLQALSDGADLTAKLPATAAGRI